MDSALKQKVFDSVEKNYPQVELFEAQLSEQDFDLNIVPYRKRNLRAPTKNPVAKFAVCINNADYPASLEVHKIYRVLPDEDAATDGDVRVVDESGEDYLLRNVAVTLAAGIFQLTLAIPQTRKCSAGYRASEYQFSAAAGVNPEG